MECHHRPPAHPGFSSSVDSRRYTHTFHGHGTLPHGASRSSGWGHPFGSIAKNQAFNGLGAWLVSRHGSDVVGCAQPSERSARRIARPLPSVLASDATPRCAPLASADRKMSGDATRGNARRIVGRALGQPGPLPDRSTAPIHRTHGLTPVVTCPKTASAGAGQVL